MTKPEWDALDAREKDALVAEKVMGGDVRDGLWAWNRVQSFSWTPEFRGNSINPNHKYLHTGAGNIGEIPEYTTSWDAMREVVEKVQTRNPAWRFGLLGGDTTIPFKLPHGTAYGGFFGWKAEFFGHEDAMKDYGQRHGEARASSAPEAVCLAALIAFGVIEP